MRRIFNAGFLLAGTFTVISMMSLLGCSPTSNTGGSSSSPTYITEALTENYENSAFHVSIEYPQDWKELPGDLTIIPQYPTYGLVVQFLSVSTKVDLAVEETDLSAQPMTLDDYSNSHISLLEQDDKVFNFDLINSAPTTLDGYPAFTILYTNKPEGTNSETLEVWTIVNNKLFRIIYGADKNEYSSSLAIVQQMIASFKITP